MTKRRINSCLVPHLNLELGLVLPKRTRKMEMQLPVLKVYQPLTAKQRSHLHLVQKDNSESEKKATDADKDKVHSGSEQLANASEDTKDKPKPLKLQKQEVKSGEESEECIYQVNAKLYQLSNIKEGWKERGVGIIKINKSKDDVEKTRIVMRSRGILKVILNIQLVKGFTVQKGFTGSLQSEKFIRLLAVDDNGDPAQYAIKTGKKETTDELYNIIVKSVPK
ncbi:CIC_collapsed_G0027630.mRNA.1.CDS.1 [Saccharomyces cerevisiae]|nr:CIC_collapsed_G0027630.mRNA.1.CDS.1 [Saccharomyces cerevisiae]